MSLIQSRNIRAKTNGCENMGELVMVSVYCLAYNHERYIRKALDGFVMQKTDFTFEVLINDDASSDGTVRIIEEYADKYPFIRFFHQKENLYGRGISIEKNIFYPNTRGRYIAYCEGDDYWTDPLKLQKQVDFMESHLECSMCCHAYLNIEANSEKLINEIHTAEMSGYVKEDKLIQYSNPTQLATNMFRRDILLKMPDVYYNRGIGDYTMLLYCLTQGKIYYMTENMANHRISSDGSWTKRVYQNPEKRCVHNEKMIEFLNDYNKITEGNFNEPIQHRIEAFRMDSAIIKHQYNNQKSNEGYRKLSIKRKAIVTIGLIFPKLARHIEDIFVRS